jgi:hypothetical protein
MRTRFEVRDALDNLQEVLLRAWERWDDGPWRRGRWQEEREKIKSILVASEANLQVKHFDDVGAIYQDLLAEERGFWKELDKFRPKLLNEGDRDVGFPEFASWSRSRREHDPRWIFSEILSLRHDLITAMRKTLQGPTSIQRVFARPLLFSLVPALAVAFLWLLQIVIGPNSDSRVQEQLERMGLSWFFLRMLLFAVPAYAASVVSMLVGAYWINERWRQAARRIRHLIRRYEKSVA